VRQAPARFGRGEFNSSYFFMADVEPLYTAEQLKVPDGFAVSVLRVNNGA
jgi:hypothetical protein